MAIKTINKSIDIKAPKEKVWSVLLQDATYRIWSAEFSEGSYAETDWEEGSKVVFKDDSGSGIFGRITKNVPGEIISMQYDGMLLDNKEDYESKDAKEIKGATETYRLSEEDGVTHLEIESGMTEEYFDMMNEAWDRALLKVKELAEAEIESDEDFE